MTKKGEIVCALLVLFWSQFVMAIFEIHRHHYHYHDFSGFHPPSLQSPSHSYQKSPTDVAANDPVSEKSEKTEPTTKPTDNPTTEKVPILKDVVNDYLVSEEPEEAVTMDNTKHVTMATTPSTPVTTTTSFSTTAKSSSKKMYKTTYVNHMKVKIPKKVNNVHLDHNAKYGTQQVHFKIHFENDAKSKKPTKTKSTLQKPNSHKNQQKFENYSKSKKLTKTKSASQKTNSHKNRQTFENDAKSKKPTKTKSTSQKTNSHKKQQKVNVVQYNMKSKKPKEVSYSDSYIKLWS